MLIVDFIKGPFLAALCREIALDTTNNLLRSAFRMSQTFNPLLRNVVKWSDQEYYTL